MHQPEQNEGNELAGAVQVLWLIPFTHVFSHVEQMVLGEGVTARHGTIAAAKVNAKKAASGSVKHPSSSGP